MSRTGTGQDRTESPGAKPVQPDMGTKVVDLGTRIGEARIGRESPGR